MNVRIPLAAVAVVAVCLASVLPARAQLGVMVWSPDHVQITWEGAGPLEMVTVAEVTRQLGLSPEQVAQGKRIATAYQQQLVEVRRAIGNRDFAAVRAMREKAAESGRELREIVGAENYQRMQEIACQVRGLHGVFFDRQSAPNFGITPAQQAERSRLMREITEKLPPRGNEADQDTERAYKERMDRERTFYQQLDKALLAILTEAQQTQWKEMIGEPASEELLAAARGFRADPDVVANMNAAMRGIPTAPSLFEVARVPGVARLLQLNEKQLAGARELAIEAERQRRGGFGFGGGRGGFGGGRGPGGRAALEALLQKRREEYEGRLKRLTELVGEEKFERLQQISRQASGLRDAFVMQQNREALGISSEQQQQASDILSDADPKYRATNSDDERQRVLSAFRTALDKLLTDEQRQKWQQMLGKPVEAKLLDEVLAARR